MTTAKKTMENTQTNMIPRRGTRLPSVRKKKAAEPIIDLDECLEDDWGDAKKQWKK